MGGDEEADLDEVESMDDEVEQLKAEMEVLRKRLRGVRKEAGQSGSGSQEAQRDRVVRGENTKRKESTVVLMDKERSRSPPLVRNKQQQQEKERELAREWKEMVEERE